MKIEIDIKAGVENLNDENKVELIIYLLERVDSLKHLKNIQKELKKLLESDDF